MSPGWKIRLRGGTFTLSVSLKTFDALPRAEAGDELPFQVETEGRAGETIRLLTGR